MKKQALIIFLAMLLITMVGCREKSPDIEDTPEEPPSPTAIDDDNEEEGETDMQIVMNSNEDTIVFELNNSQAAKELYDQLPLTIQVENYSNNEKIFYPPEELNTHDAPEASGDVGSLAYYAPWGNVVMFYAPFNPSPGSGLYELGQAITGSENIQNLTGDIEINIE